MTHADISDFIKLAGGELGAARRGEIQAHVAQCGSCRAEQRRFLAVHGVLGEWTVDASSRDVWAAVERKLDRPAMIRGSFYASADTGVGRYSVATIIHPRWRTVAAWSRVAAAIVVGVGLGHVIGRLSLPNHRLEAGATPAPQVAELKAAKGLLLHALESPSPAGLFPTVLDLLEPGAAEETAR